MADGGIFAWEPITEVPVEATPDAVLEATILTASPSYTKDVVGAGDAEASWTCCQGSSFASCSAEYRTTGDAAAFCAMFGGTPSPGRCGPPACAAQGCCTNAPHLVLTAGTDVGFDGTAGEIATSAPTCTALGGAVFVSGPRSVR
jgi:hypothetical protein